jgi:iron complex transport system permease protein
MAALLTVVILSLTQGAVALSGEELWLAALRQGSQTHQTILWDLRLPRVLAALLVGAALGMAGALLQGLLRNGLASPFLLGISSGSGLVVVLLVSLGLWQAWIPFGAWLGAIATTLLVYLLARSGTTLSVERLILGGVAFGSLFGAVQSMLLLLMQDGRVQAALTWLIGSLNGRGWREVTFAAPVILVALGLGCLLAKQVNLLSLGDELAVGLGTSLLRSRCLIGAVATLLAASAVSVAGLVGFVGLIVPHGVRLLVGTDHRLVLPFSALGGALVLATADFVARSGPVELPVGIVTALLGAPVFIGLLYRRSAIARRL